MRPVATEIIRRSAPTIDPIAFQIGSPFRSFRIAALARAVRALALANRVTIVLSSPGSSISYNARTSATRNAPSVEAEVFPNGDLGFGATRDPSTSSG